MKILTVVGARPQFIKASVVSNALRAAEVDEVMIHTGQHYDANMSQVFFDELGIAPPAVNLGVHESTHGAMTAAMLTGIEAQIIEHEPSAVLVYGDTNSTLAGALAASKLHVPVAHVEAGLRSFNRRMPEEQNRVVTDHLSDLLLTPTTTATDNLAREGIDASMVAQVGDVMYDAALHFGRMVDAADSERPTAQHPWSSRYVLATVHRAENTDDPERLSVIIAALEALTDEIDVVLPVHPRTRALLGDRAGSAVHLIEPVGYLDMVRLERGATVICTDSGGVQKEAYFHGVPCVTLRDETEWTELVDLGWNRICPPASVDVVVDAVRSAMTGTPTDDSAPYGHGNASELITTELLDRWGDN